MLNIFCSLLNAVWKQLYSGELHWEKIFFSEDTGTSFLLLESSSSQLYIVLKAKKLTVTTLNVKMEEGGGIWLHLEKEFTCHQGI